MRIIDISTTIEEDMIVWKNYPHKSPKIEVVSDHQRGHAHETKVTMDLHTGTHLDMPLHMIAEGKTLDDFDLSRVITSCRVLDLTQIEGNNISERIIMEATKDKPIQPGEFVLFKTRNSYRNKTEGFDMEFVFVDKSGAKFLSECKINGVGIDTPGIERSQEGHPTHITLLAENIIIMEGINLIDVEPGIYQLIALPIKVKGGEGGLVRAVLIAD